MVLTFLGFAVRVVVEGVEVPKSSVDVLAAVAEATDEPVAVDAGIEVAALVTAEEGTALLLLGVTCAFADV